LVGGGLVGGGLVGTGVDVGGGVLVGARVGLGVGVLVLVGTGVGGRNVGAEVGGMGVALGWGCGVELGKKKNGVLVGRSTKIRVGVFVSEAEWLKAVWLKGGIRVLEGMGVIVIEAVIVGVAEIRGVAVAVEEAVFVGRVNVGKGPSKASAVPAMAVLVAATSL
jgi:hypothetical protein